MPYLTLIFSIAITGYYLVRKLPKVASWTEQKQSQHFKFWSENFSFEILNQIVGLTLNQLLILFWISPQVPSAGVNLSSALLAIFCAVVGLDFVFYWRHRFYHKYLMRFHSVHHAGSDFDMTLSLRIHPFETVVQFLLFAFVTSFLELNAWQATTVNFVFAAQAFYSHLDLPLFPAKIERLAAMIFVIPESHRTHHELTGSRHNFGYLFSIWDRIFKTAHRAEDNV